MIIMMMVMIMMDDDGGDCIAVLANHIKIFDQIFFTLCRVNVELSRQRVPSFRGHRGGFDTHSSLWRSQ